MSAPPVEKTKALIDLLYSLSRDGEIEWQVSFDDAAIEAKLGRNIVQLHQLYDPDTEDNYVEIRLKNAKGDVVDEILPGLLHEQAPPFAEYKKYWMVFDALFSLANRQARGADKTIDEIVAELEKKKIPF